MTKEAVLVGDIVSTYEAIMSTLARWKIPHMVLDVTAREDVEAEIERLASTHRRSQS